MKTMTRDILCGIADALAPAVLLFLVGLIIAVGLAAVGAWGWLGWRVLGGGL